MAFHMDATAMTNNAWQASYTQDNRYRENFSYDWNGNIITAQRYSGSVFSGSALIMDDLVYEYAGNSNLLNYIRDISSAAACTFSDDLDDQGSNNYVYDEIGALITDVSERITGIDWNPYGKMKAVHKDPANNTNACTSTEYGDADVEYLYTASQQRLCKIVKPHKPAGAGISDQDQWTYYWYAYDAGGQVMAVYKQTFDSRSLPAGDYKVHFDVQEHDVYGSGRLGIRKGDDDGKSDMTFTGTISGKFSSLLYYNNNTGPLVRDHYVRELGNKQYEVANHLGNVLVTVSDKRLGQDIYNYTNTGAGSNYSYNALQNSYYYTPGTGLYTQSAGSDGKTDWYTPDVLSYTDYYSFGATQPGRNGAAAGGEYRYKFNGMETDQESKNTDEADYTTEYRAYDARVGRWFSPDWVVKYYESPYAAFSNNPIYFVDPSGLDSDPPSKDKTSNPNGAAEGGNPNGPVEGETCGNPDGSGGVYINGAWEPTSEGEYVCTDSKPIRIGIWNVANVNDEKFNTQVEDRSNPSKSGADLFNQGYSGYCGAAALVHIWAADHPDQYNKVMYDLYYRGSSTINGFTIKAPTLNSTGHGYDIADHDGMPDADFVLFESLKYTTSIMYGYGSGDFFDFYTPEMLGIMAHGLGYSAVDINYNPLISSGPFTNSFDDIVDKYNAGYRIIMIINTEMISTTQNSNPFSNHFITFEGGFSYNKDKGTGGVVFSYWSWGKLYKNKDISARTFMDNYYGTIFIKK